MEQKKTSKKSISKKTTIKVDTEKKDNVLIKLKKVFNVYLLESLICALASLGIGIFLLAKPEVATRTASMLIGIILIIVGLASIFNYALNEKFSFFRGHIIDGIVALLIAILLITNPFAITTMLTICVGIYLIFNGVIKMTYAISFNKAKEESWLVMLLMAIVSTFFGVAIIIHPFFANLYFTQTAGLFIVLHSIIELTQVALLKQRSEFLIKLFK